jgi:hypothetical protein
VSVFDIKSVLRVQKQAKILFFKKPKRLSIKPKFGFRVKFNENFKSDVVTILKDRKNSRNFKSRMKILKNEILIFKINTMIKIVERTIF